MRRVKRAFIWLSRIRYCRGFGVQSPNDYRFIRYVVNEHSPYYQYADLSRLMPGVDADERRLCQLYFRLANALQPKWYLDMMPKDEVSARYVCAGCRHISYLPINASYDSQHIQQLIKDKTLIRFSHATPVALIETMWGEVLKDTAISSVIVVEGIYDDHARKECWHRMIAQEQVRVSFDLYYCGILLFESRIYKKHYKVNF